MWPYPVILLLLLVHIRCHTCSSFKPIRRYHPTTKLKSNAPVDLVAAESFQYAYDGGETHQEGHSTHDDHVTALDQSQAHPAISFNPTSRPNNGKPTSFDVKPTGFSGFGGGLQEGPDHHTGEVDLSASASDAGFQPDTYHPDHNGYSYGPPMGHDYSYRPPMEQGYAYGPPQSYVFSPPAITTARPEEPKQNTALYTYYYLGRHLWYIPLYFSIYFIIYVGALVLKSVARHKILFPQNLKLAVQQQRALRHLEAGERKFFMR